ncbi:UNVERIFIED_CONTAM: hypothetical protein FKN15_012654 [Acipenser sinensis]
MGERAGVGPAEKTGAGADLTGAVAPEVGAGKGSSAVSRARGGGAAATRARGGGAVTSGAQRGGAAASGAQRGGAAASGAQKEGGEEPSFTTAPTTTPAVQSGAAGCGPSLLDTLPVGLDLPSLDLEPRSPQNRSQFSTWFLALLPPSTKTSLRCSQTSLTLPLVTASLPLGDWTSLHRAPAADLCPLPAAAASSAPVVVPVAPDKPVGSLVAGARSLPGWAGTWTDPPSSPPVEEGEKGHWWTRGWVVVF